MVLVMGFLLMICTDSTAQRSSAVDRAVSAVLPDAPALQIEIASAADPQAGQAQNTQQPETATPPAPSGSGEATKKGEAQSSSQSPAQEPNAQETQHQKAEEQLKEQERQRVAGVMATFNTTRNPNAAPLSPGQKYRLFFRSAFDPWPFGLNAVVAGVNQASDAEPQWGQGMQGYAKRYGAAYSDYFIGNFFGNAVLPSLLHEDPRYFQKGSGSFMSRFLWAAASTGWCKRDQGGWGPNWANVGGNLIGAAIGRAYYPASERTVTDTVTDGLTVSAEGIVGAEVIEFWPDMVRHHRRKQAEKQARASDAAAKHKQQGKNQKPQQ
ncbi:MAG: hypothetical protein WBP85_15050 [Terracidiphilus sp.]